MSSLTLFVGLCLNVAFAQIPSPLPQKDYEKLQSVAQRVKFLRRPNGHIQHYPAAESSICSLVGGLISANVSTTCCRNVHVVLQKHLSTYGIAAKCDDGWQCDKSGVKPMPAFEAQSLMDLCSEAQCSSVVASAMRSHWMTKKGAVGMNNMCKSLASLTSLSGKVSKVEAITRLLHKFDNLDPAEYLDCQEEVCGLESRKTKLCDSKNTSDKCYSVCCEHPSCFPGDSTLVVKGLGQTPLIDVKVGHQVLVERKGRIVYERVLAFLHSLPHVPDQDSSFRIIAHEQGMFRASAGHIVFVIDSYGRQLSKQVIELSVGEQLAFVDSGQQVVPSRVLELRGGSGQSGMYAPWTDSGTVIVDGVVASTYASPSVHQDLSHDLAHKFHLPLRLYHSFGFSVVLQPFWNKFCRTKPNSRPEQEATLEEMHPYVAFAFTTLHLDWLLSKT